MSSKGPELGAGLDATANLATRARRQDLGLRAAMALHVLLRHTRSYDERNAVFAPPLAQLSAAIEALVGCDGAFEISFSRDGVRANRQALKLDALARPLLSVVFNELELRGTAGFKSAGAPPEADLRLLIAWLRSNKQATAVGDAHRPFSLLRLLPSQDAAALPTPGVPAELRLARAYAAAALFAGRTLSQLRAGGEVAPSWAAGHLVRELVDLERLAPLTFLRLALCKAEGEAYFGQHAANVAVLAIAFGKRLGIARRRRHDLGMSALFHDVGMAAMPASVLGKTTSLDERERWAVAANPLFAARVLLRDREVHAAALERALAAYECHLDLEVPAAGEPHEIGFCGRVVALSETFDALTTARPYRPALSPREALATMRGALAHRFDRRLLQLFELAVGPLLR